MEIVVVVLKSAVIVQLSHVTFSLFTIWCLVHPPMGRKGIWKTRICKIICKQRPINNLLKSSSFFQSAHPLSFFFDRLLALLSLMMMMMMMMVVSQEGTLHHFQYKDANLLTLWVFFSIASWRSFLSLSSRSLLSFRLSLTRRDLIALLIIMFSLLMWLSCYCWLWCDLVLNANDAVVLSTSSCIKASKLLHS